VVARIEAALHPGFVALLVRKLREHAYRTVPAAVTGRLAAGLVSEIVSSEAGAESIALANPKSSSFDPDFVSMMLLGFKSR
jgi:hypothetical protein